MKNIMMIFATVVFLFSFAMGQASAQEGPLLKAYIPFAFTIGSKTLPAGDYEIRRGLSTQPELLLIKGEDHENWKQEMFFLTNMAQASVTPTKTQLVFDHVGDRYFLSKVWMAGENSGREAPISKVERKMELSGLTREQMLINANSITNRASD
ncbi:MAG: hypothetical protein JST85_27960 [Acidobacteria bacterium]|nr:hypothetical protein [Acidobacteriota bacterium]